MKNIKLNDKIGIDLQKLIAGKMLLQAGSGGGKSYAIRRILEQSFGSIPHLILDTEGEFSSLREKYDYILIGKDQDITADPKTAALMALRLWEERVSAIIDLYELSPWDRSLFVKNFVDALINAPKKLWRPVLLIIDEAHEYAPENDKSDSGRALHLLASKGRKRHIGAIFATQRISSLSKNIVASCKNKLIGYASETNDVKRAAFELGFTPNEARTLRDLDPGEFYAFGPALTKEVTKIKIGKVSTSHEQVGNTAVGRTAPASAKVKAALAKLADLPQAAAEEAKTIAEFKQALATAKRTIAELERNDRTTPTVSAMGVSQWKEYGKKYQYWEFFKKETTQQVIDAVKKAIKKRDGEWVKILKNWKDHARFWRSITDKLVDTREKMTSEPEDHPSDMQFEEFAKPTDMPKLEIEIDRNRFGNDTIKPVLRGSKQTYLDSYNNGPLLGKQTDPDTEKQMGAGERQVLIAIAQQPDGMTREHITVQTGYKRSTRDAYIQRLIQKGYIGFAGVCMITDAGIAALGNDYKPLPTGRALFEYHLFKLPEGEGKILKILYEASESEASRGGMTRDAISEWTGFKRSTRDAYIQRLATRQLVVVEGQTIRISEHLL